jgi:hypothetical protein
MRKKLVRKWNSALEKVLDGKSPKELGYHEGKVKSLVMEEFTYLNFGPYKMYEKWWKNVRGKYEFSKFTPSDDYDPELESKISELGMEWLFDENDTISEKLIYDNVTSCMRFLKQVKSLKKKSKYKRIMKMRKKYYSK